MLNRIRQAITDYNMIEHGDDVLIALSGGADSVALCFALQKLSAELGFSVRACHINHNLRGKESDADEQYVCSFCEKHGIKCGVYSVDVLSEKRKHESVEECARRLRYAALEKCAELTNAKIATAHTASDNAETVLLNLTRGTALKGLCGIPTVRGNIIRPLIYCTRADIEQFCTENELAFVTDATNLDEAYSRNKIRLNVIPKLREINPSLHDSITRMTYSLYLDNVYLEHIAEQLLSDADNGDKTYSTAILATADDCILSRVIRSLLEQNNTEPSALRINECIQIIRRNNGKINLRRDVFAVVHKGQFSIEHILQNYREKN